MKIVWHFSRVPLLVVLAILAALAFGVHSLTWYAERNPEQVEAWISEELGEPVRFDSMDANWDGLDLSLTLTGIQIGDSSVVEGGMRFDRLALGVALVQGLLELDWRPAYLTVSGARLVIHRQMDRTIRIGGFENRLAKGAESEESSIRGAEFWMLSQARVRIENSELHIRDDRRWAHQEPLHLTDVTLELENLGQAHRLHGQAQFSPTYGRKVRFDARIEGDPLGRNWSGTASLEADDMLLAGWLGDRNISGVSVHHASMALNADFEWSEGLLDRADAQLQLGDIRLQSVDHPTRELIWPELAGKLRWLREAEGWKLDLDQLNLVSSRGEWRPQSARVTVSEPENGTASYALHMDRLRIDDIAELAALSNRLPDPLGEALPTMRPGGWLQRIALAMEKRGDQISYDFDTALVNLRTDAWAGVPGVTGICADLSLRPGTASVVLRGRDTELHFPGLFRDRLHLDKIDGLLAVVHGEEGLRVQGLETKVSNPDIALGADFSFSLPAGGEPHLDLKAHFVGQPEDRVKHYLPAGVIPDDAMEWLDRAFLAGKVRNGVFRFNGQLNEFPFDKPGPEGKTGEFLVEFDVFDGELDFSPDYPNVESVTTKVRFYNQGLTVENGAGKLLGADVSDIRVEIPNLDDTTVRVTGHAEADVRQFDRFVQQTPLRKRVGPSLEQLALRGKAKLDLDVYLPLNDQDIEVNGELTFPGNDLFVKAMGVRFTDFKGTIQFTPEGVEAKGLRAMFRGEPLKVGVRSNQRGDTEIAVRGKLALQSLLGPDGESLADFASGKALWKLDIVAPSWRRPKAGIKLDVRSDLRGIALALPRPLAKSTEQVRSLAISTTHQSQGLGPLVASYGDELKARFDITDSDGVQGEVRYASGDAPEPVARGIRIVANVTETELAPWVELTDQGGASATGGDLELRVEANVDLLHAYGRRVRDARILLEPGDDGRGEGWKLDVESERVAGTIFVPRDPDKDSPVLAVFTHMHIAEQKDDAGKKMPTRTDPRQLPPVRLIVDDFRYGKRQLGRLEMEATPSSAGLNVHQVDLASDAFTMHSWGNWTFDGSDHLSRFTIELNSDNFAEAMQAFDLGEMMESEGFSAVFDTRWVGAPMDFDLARLDGDLSLALGKGRVLDVDPGAGRLFGLLSFATLPRRLRGDFTDLSKDGFVFDAINGDFELVSGVARTQNLHLTGPAAKLDIRGQVNLADETVDQVVDVIPEVSSTLPLAGILAGGVGVGAALLVIQQVLNEPLNKIAKIQYRMRGPWAKPEITRLGARDEDKTKAPESAEEAFGLEN